MSTPKATISDLMPVTPVRPVAAYLGGKRALSKRLVERIEGIELEFKRGAVVAASARTGADLLARLLDTDEAVTVLVWAALGPRIANRWSLTDSEAGALAGLGLLTIVATAAHATIAILLLHPSTPYSSTSNWIIVALGVLPTHAVTAGLMSLVGSWTSARRQRERELGRQMLLVRSERDALQLRVRSGQGEVEQARPDILAQDVERLRRSCPSGPQRRRP